MQLKQIRETRKLQGELQKIKPPSFDGQKFREDVEVWILVMKKYLQLHDYSNNLEARIAIYNIQGKDSMWWEQLKKVKHINEKQIYWDEFSNYIKQKYLSEQYYE